MSHRIKALALIFGLAVATATVVTMAETDGSDHRVVSLRNGQVLRGSVSQAGNRFVIRLSGGGEIRVPDGDVEVVGKDIGEVYLYKRHRINPESAEDHYKLADWCLRHKLVSRAMEELEWVRKLRPRWTKIKSMERRLDLALNPPRPRRTKLSTNQPGISREALDDYIKSLPSASVAQFTHRIQPLLVNRCASAGCHGTPENAKLHLTRTAKGRTLTRRITQTNLYAIMKHVDRSSPSRSKLLVVPLGPHGNAHEAVFGERDLGQYEQLRDWVLSLAENKAPSVAQTQPQPQVQPNAPASLPALPDQVVGLRNVPFPARPAGARPADPFDPSGFNARHTGRSTPNNGSALAPSELFPPAKEPAQLMPPQRVPFTNQPPNSIPNPQNLAPASPPGAVPGRRPYPAHDWQKIGNTRENRSPQNYPVRPAGFDSPANRFAPGAPSLPAGPQGPQGYRSVPQPGPQRGVGRGPGFRPPQTTAGNRSGLTFPKPGLQLQDGQYRPNTARRPGPSQPIGQQPGYGAPNRAPARPPYGQQPQPTRRAQPATTYPQTLRGPAPPLTTPPVNR